MQSWCSNRLVINAAEEHIVAVKRLLNADLQPTHQEAILKSRKLFVAGCAGLLRTVEPIEFQIFPQLVRAGIGVKTPQNQAFTDWLVLLKTEPDLDIGVSRYICTLYEESGLGFRSWDTLKYAEQSILSILLSQTKSDWFNFPFMENDLTALKYWKMFDEKSVPVGFDMRFLVPTQLLPEINGMSGSLFDYQSTFQLYHDLYETRWPYGMNVKIRQLTKTSIEVEFDTLWNPPSEQVISSLSEIYGCDITHTFSERGIETLGFCKYQFG